MPDRAILFAAGFGTRMGDLTKDCPKPLVQVSGRALIDYSLDHLKAAGIESIVVNLHYKAEMLVKHLRNHKGVHPLIEQPDILETGGGLKNALPILGHEPVFAANTDAIVTGQNPFFTLRDAWRPESMDGLLLLIPKKEALEHSGNGDFNLDSGGLLSQKGDRLNADYVYTGFQIIKTDQLDRFRQPKFSISELWKHLIDQDKLFGMIHPGQWVDVGTPNGIKVSEQVLKQAKHV